MVLVPKRGNEEYYIGSSCLLKFSKILTLLLSNMTNLKRSYFLKL